MDFKRTVDVGAKVNMFKCFILIVDVCGVYYAAPCITLDSDQDSDSDDCTDDAATVIFKSSPYSSPAPGRSH